MAQVREMAKAAYEAGLNIDYFPTNFVVKDDRIFYIDYECNDYMDEWNFENWGRKYYSRRENSSIMWNRIGLRLRPGAGAVRAMPDVMPRLRSGLLKHESTAALHGKS